MAWGIPRTILVGPHTYTVVRLPKAQMPHSTDLGPDEGHCDPNTLRILIQARLRRSKAQEALLHEVMHACSYPELLGATVDDETFVLGISPRLLHVFQENPHLVKYLQEK